MNHMIHSGARPVTPSNTTMTISKAAALIKLGLPLSLAGTEAALDQLPAGNWIAGTIPYFMLTEGGVIVNDERVFVNQLAPAGQVRFGCYRANELESVTRNTPDNGYAIAIIPAGSRCHQAFAENAADLPEAFLKPTAGWIAGVHLSDLGNATAKVYFGPDASKHADRIVVAHVAVPAGRTISVETVNIFEPGDGDVLCFDRIGFEVGECTVNGTPENLADYLTRMGLDDGKLPLVGDYAGAHVNVSIQSVDVPDRRTTLYAPVFPGIDYRIARPVGDYAAEFQRRLGAQDQQGATFACNCILNFVFGELEGKAIGGVAGPVTFGEIAYQLLNQTAVLVRVT